MIILGAGGHAKVVISTLHENRIYTSAVFDDDSDIHNEQILSVPIKGFISESTITYEDAFIAIGDNQIRHRIYQKYNQYHNWVSVIHPFAYVHPSVKIGKGSIIMAGAVVQPDTIIGDQVIVNTSASIDHDCKIGDYSHIAPGVHLAGGVDVREGAFFGISSSAVPYVKVGEWSIIGAGSVVVNDIPSKQLVVGVPAKIKK